MKKLMFVAAIAASCVVSADNVAEGFDAADGIYNVTITEKTLDLVYAQETKYDPAADEWTSCLEATSKEEAIAEAQEYFDTDINVDDDCTLKQISTKKIDGEWNYRIKYTQASGDATSAKVVSGVVNGILVKNAGGTLVDSEGNAYEDGALVLWYKDKYNRCYVDNAYRYMGWSMKLADPESEDCGALLQGRAVANKAIGGLYLGINKLRAYASGFGTSLGRDEDGNYWGVKTLSGNAATAYVVEDEDEIAEIAYGTWKIAKDANMTKLSQKGKYGLATILAKKGAVEVGEYPSDVEEE